MYYALGTIESVENPMLLQEYVNKLLSVLQRFGGSILAIDDAVHRQEGKWPYIRTVLLAFPSAKQVQEWYHSPEYQEIAVLCNMAASMNLVFIRGLGESALAKVA